MPVLGPAARRRLQARWSANTPTAWRPRTTPCISSTRPRRAPERLTWRGRLRAAARYLYYRLTGRYSVKGWFLLHEGSASTSSARWPAPAAPHDVLRRHGHTDRLPSGRTAAHPASGNSTSSSTSENWEFLRCRGAGELPLRLSEHRDRLGCNASSRRPERRAS